MQLAQMHQVYLSINQVYNEKYALNIPYVIREGGMGRGLFSLVSSITCHLHLADTYGLVPIVDLQERHCEYTEPSHGGRLPANPWEYYFEPVSRLSLADRDSWPIYIASKEGYPLGYPFSVSSSQELIEAFSKYVRVQDHHVQEVSAFARKVLNTRTLGVHYRAQEMRVTRGHWYPPSLLQITQAIDMALAQKDYQRIFLVSEDLDCLFRLRSRYGQRIVTRDHFRTRSPRNAYKEYCRDLHKYHLGKECLIDAMLLSRCDGLIRCTSNIAEGAKLFRAKPYELEIMINNGPNNARLWGIPLHRYSWRVRNLLPSWAGGFGRSAFEIAAEKGFERIYISKCP